MYPEDPRQPFYNPNAKEMTPLARLYIRRTKTIARSCDEEFLESQILDVSENTEEGATRRMFSVHPIHTRIYSLENMHDLLFVLPLLIADG